MYIAIDGGGTKTEYLLLDEHKTELAGYIGKGTNHDFYPDNWEGVQRELDSAISELLRRGNAISGGLQADRQNIRIFAGMSGADTGEDLVNLRKCFENIGFLDCHVINDGFLSLFAQTDDGIGIAYNCGTGLCCAGCDEKGNTVKLAGMDEWSGDTGNGNWIAVETYRRAYRGMILCSSKADVNGEKIWAKRYMDTFSLKTAEELMDFWSVIKTPEHIQERKAVVSLLFTGYEEGLQQALEMIEIMRASLIENVLAAAQRLDFTTFVQERKCIPVILTGSVLTKAASPAYLQETEKQLNAQAPEGMQFRFVQADQKPVQGAVKWGFYF